MFGSIIYEFEIHTATIGVGVIGSGNHKS